MGWLMRRRFGILLFTLLLLIVGYPLSHSFVASLLLYDAFLTLVFLAAVPVVFQPRWSRFWGILLGTPTLVLHWMGHAVPAAAQPPMTVGLNACAALFLAFTTAVILRGVVQEKRISLDGLCGALSGYLLVAVLFSHLYCIVESVAPGSFQGGAALAGPALNLGALRFRLTYFSLVTLTTLGYGDITPASDVARSLVVVEAVLGQFYIAVLIGELVGMRVAQAMAAEPPRPDASP
jgi:hypothetical protein